MTTETRRIQQDQHELRMMELQARSLKVGQKIYSNLSDGGRFGVIFQITGEQAPESIRWINGHLINNGNATVEVVFDNGTIRAFSERIIRSAGVVLIDEIVGADEISQVLEQARYFTLKKTRDA